MLLMLYIGGLLYSEMNITRNLIPKWLRLKSVLRRGSVDVHSLFIVVPMFAGDFVLCACFCYAVLCVLFLF